MSDTGTQPDGQDGQQGGGQEQQGQQDGPWASPEAARAEIERLRKESARYRTENRDLKPLAEKARELEEAGKTEVEKLTNRLQASEASATEAGQEALRLRVALRKGLTETQARRLVGSTEDELAKDADELLASFGGAQGAGPQRRPRERLAGGAAGSDGPAPDDMNQRIRRAAGRS